MSWMPKGQRVLDVGGKLCPEHRRDTVSWMPEGNIVICVNNCQPLGNHITLFSHFRGNNKVYLCRIITQVHYQSQHHQMSDRTAVASMCQCGVHLGLGMFGKLYLSFI